MQNLSGQSLGQYKVIRLIGEGGMAAVYQAHQESMKRDVAIKVIKTNMIDTDDFVLRFEREAQMVASLSHPYILKVFDYGRYGDLVYLVMELLSGGSLEQLINQGPLSLQRSAEILDPIASALDYAHQKGIIHRDLKPGNVLLDEAGRAFLTDFGLARLLNTSQKLTQSGTAVGTPAYMAPEQWKGQPAEARTDVYSLGVLLYEMLSGNLPFNGDSVMSMMYLHLHETPPDLHTKNPSIPLTVQNVVEKALAKDPEDRYQSAGALAAAYRESLSSKQPTVMGAARGTTKLPLPPPVEKKTSTPISPWLWAALVVLLVVAIGLGVVAASRLLAKPVAIPTVAQLALAASPTTLPATPSAMPIAVLATSSSTATASPTVAASLTIAPPSDAPTVTASSTSTSTATSTNTMTPTDTVLPPTITIVLPTVAAANNSNSSNGQILKGHSAAVNSVAFSPDGNYLASGSDDKTALLWSVSTGQIARTFQGHTGAVKSVAISPDGRYLLTGGADSNAILWDIQNGKQIRTFTGHTDSINGVAFAPDGQTLVTASNDKTAKLWDTETGKLIRTFSQARGQALLSIAFTPDDGRLVAVASADKTVTLWDVQSGELQRTLKGHTGAVQALAFSPNGSYLLSGSADGTARVWDPHSGKLITVLDDKGQNILSVGFTPDSAQALTAGEDGQVKAWDPQIGKMTHVFNSPFGTIRSFAFGPPGILIIATGLQDSTIHLVPLQKRPTP